MTDQPLEETTETPNINEDIAVRINALEHASRLSTNETPLSDFLDNAALIENYISTGAVPKKDKDK